MNNEKDKDLLVRVYINSARFVTYRHKDGSEGKCLLVKIPFRSLAAFKKVRKAVIHNFERKFKTDVIVVANRTIQSKFLKAHKSQQRPRSRTLTTVQNALLDDVVAPASIVGK